MKDADDKLFQAREFAELTGVTVRTLHHYDRLGLLKPSRYSRAGYRLYRASDVTRLEQIVALKFIGFSLNEIRNILSRNSIDLATALCQQREALAEKAKRLELAIQAIERAEYVIGASRVWRQRFANSGKRLQKKQSVWNLPFRQSSAPST